MSHKFSNIFVFSQHSIPPGNDPVVLTSNPMMMKKSSNLNNNKGPVTRSQRAAKLSNVSCQTPQAQSSSGTQTTNPGNPDLPTSLAEAQTGTRDNGATQTNGGDSENNGEKRQM